MKNKYLLPGLSFFFLIIILIYLANLYTYANDYHGYIIGDWLITFRAGFVRRGLSGSSMLALSDLLNIPANFVVMFIQMILYLIYMFTFFFLIRKKEIDIWFILLLLSPATLLFPINDSATVGRKEIMLFCIFGFYLYCLSKKMLENYFMVSVFSIALLIATLFHELIFFYTPYFIVAAYINSVRDKQPFRPSKPLLVILGSALIMVPLYYSKTIYGGIICEELVKRGLKSKVCFGVIGGPYEFSFSTLLDMYSNDGYYWSYGIGLLLGLIPVVLWLKNLKSEVVSLKKALIAVLLLFLFSFPLFFLAIDWGRWINIHFIMLIFTFTLLLKDRSLEWKNEKFTIPSFWRSKRKPLRLLNNAIFLAICFAYLSFWQMRHYGSFPVFYLDKYATWEREVYETIGVTEELFMVDFGDI